MRTFPLATILSITTGRFLAEKFSDMQSAMAYIANTDVFTHATPRIAECVTPFLLEKFPELQNADLDKLDKYLDEAHNPKHGVQKFLIVCVQDNGMKEHYDVPRMPPGSVEKINPLVELGQMMSKRK